jgi:hypothetical protein
VSVCEAAADQIITIEELTECLQELKKLRRRVNHEWLNEEVRDEAIGEAHLPERTARAAA